MLLFLLYLLFPLCNCFFVEINLNSKNESKSLKLLCGPPAENLNPKSKHKVLWHGSQFGKDEQQKLAENFETDSLVPNLSVKSSNRHLCYLMAPEDAAGDQTPQKIRVSRNSLASIPLENGICPPGHRIDVDRCFPCFPGSYTSGQQTKCFLCPKDFYMDKKAADSCWPCPEGKKTLAQGADSEDACVYFDEFGHPAAMQSPPWTIIYSMIGVIIACVWIIIFILLVRYWKELKPDNADQTERGESGMDPRLRSSLLQGKSIRKDGEASDYSGPADHIYAEISDSEDIYEDPRQPPDQDMYLDLEAPELPPKRWKKSVAEEQRKSVDSDGYEIPFKRSSNNQYEIPIKGSAEDHFPEIPIKKLSSNGYEIPIKNRMDDHIYEIPIKKSTDDHFYEEISIKTSPSNEYEVPVKQRADEIPKSIQEDLYDDVQYISDEEKRELDADEDNDRRLSKTYSMGFVQDSSSVEGTKKARGERRPSNTYRIPLELYKKRIFPENTRKSNERVINIPGKHEDMYYIPEEDSDESW